MTRPALSDVTVVQVALAVLLFDAHHRGLAIGLFLVALANALAVLGQFFTELDP